MKTTPTYKTLLSLSYGLPPASPSRGGRYWGQCEEVTFRCGVWQKGRQEQQMIRWFGYLPRFLITLAADYCSQCSDAEFCALVEHELYHICQEHNQYGEPKFTEEGFPKLKLRGHDVEEFVGVVSGTAQARTCSISSTLLAGLQRWPKLTFREPAVRAC